MKKYSKPSIIAKNLPSGSYAAGCPAKNRAKDCMLFANNYEACADCYRAK